MPSSRSQNSDEPPGLLKILGAVFSGVLFGWFFSKLKTPIHESAESVHPEDGADDGSTGTKPPLPVAVTIESYPPPAVTEEDKAEKKRERRLRWGGFAASVATVLITLGILCVTWKYTNYARGQLRVMDGQLKTMQTQLELQERPWIKITEVQTRGNGPIVPALSFQKGAGMPFQQATFQLKISLKNIGHSVAEIAPRFHLFFPLWKDFDTAVTAEEKRFCQSDAGRALPDYYPSAILFPDEPYDWYGAGAQLVDDNNINRFTETGETKFVIPVVIVCANYRLKSLSSTYQTGAVYEVFRKDNRTRFFEAGVGVPADSIFLIRNQLKDFAY
jgi:hypothetical protein